MKKAFIIAQSPLQSTVRDFWKMMMIYKVSAIVMCFDEQENLMVRTSIFYSTFYE